MAVQDEYLSEGEKIISNVHPSVVILLFRLISLAIAIIALWLIFNFSLKENLDPNYQWIVLLIVIAVGIFIAFVFYLSWLKTNYIITNKRVRYYSGILGVQNKDMTLEDVQNVKYQESFIGVIFNYGDIYISSSAKDEPIIFQSIPSPRKYADQIRFLANV